MIDGENDWQADNLKGTYINSADTKVNEVK